MINISAASDGWPRVLGPWWPLGVLLLCLLGLSTLLTGYLSECSGGDEGSWGAGAVISAPFLPFLLLLLMWTVGRPWRSRNVRWLGVAAFWLVLLSNAWACVLSVDIVSNAMGYGTLCQPGDVLDLDPARAQRLAIYYLIAPLVLAALSGLNLLRLGPAA